MMSSPGQLNTFADDGNHVYGNQRIALMAGLSGFQDLINRVMKTVGVRQHGGVKLFLLFLTHIARLQSLEIKADGRDGRFQLMGDGVDEAVLLLATADLTHQENRV